MVILLMALESIHILHLSSFFGLNTVGTAHGLRLSLTKPLSNNFWTCFLNSSFFQGVSLYIALFSKMAPGIKSIWWLMLLIGGNEWGNSSTTMSTKFSNNSWISSGKSSTKVLVRITLGFLTTTITFPDLSWSPLIVPSHSWKVLLCWLIPFLSFLLLAITCGFYHFFP